MKISKRSLLVVLSLMLALTVTALGTVAYMTDQDTATNTFTVGNIDIIVDEDNVDQDSYPGGDTDGDGNPDLNIPDRDKNNDYKLIPGATYVKDPRVTVLEGSEECYIRMRVELNCYAKLAELAQKYGKPTDALSLLAQFVQIDAANWEYQKSGVRLDTLTYEYWYKPTAGESEKVDASLEEQILPPLFSTFNVPNYYTGDDLKGLQGLKMDVFGDAIQTETFNSVEDAWAAFDNQHGMATSIYSGMIVAVPDVQDVQEDLTVQP